jgi:hypothetical protein
VRENIIKMSDEEWLAFHANPTIEGLTAELTKRTYIQTFTCCVDVFDVMNKHFVGDKIRFVKRIRELGYNSLYGLQRIGFYVTQPNCIEMLAAFDIAPNIVVLETACRHFWRFDGSKNILQLIDRGYPRPEYNKLPQSAVDFVISRDYARCGAIAVIGALSYRLRREQGWKDISQIIGRVVWSTRRFYKKDE